jgi:steroid 5-alpha reductase family enzyme
MTFLEIYALAGAALLIFATALYLVSLLLKDASIIDSFWGIFFLIASIVYVTQSEGGVDARQTLILVLVTLWSLRLSLYIAWRNWGTGEDFRYAKWREQHGSKWWWRSFLQVFFLQALLAWIISIPLLAASFADSPTKLTPIDALGVLVWTVGFFFEAVGDWQMARFKANAGNKGKVLDSGVWRYTRHPNYFGDATQWWGFWLIALAAGGVWTVYAPVIMTWLLLRVSGVAMLERSLAETKPQYRDYIKRTSAFVPMPPREKSSE